MRSWPLSFALLAALSAHALAQTEPATKPAAPTVVALTPEQKGEILKEVDKIVDERVFVVGVDFDKWPEYREKHAEAIAKAETERQFTSAVNRAFREFGISHINLRTPSMARARRGIPEPEKKPDPSAGWQYFGGYDLEARLGWQQTPTQTGPTSKLTWLNPTVAVLKVFSFTRGYEKKHIQGLMEEANKAETLVLDLRSNGGGSTDNLRHLLSMFMKPETEIGTFINRRDFTEYAEEIKENGSSEAIRNSESMVKEMMKIASAKKRRYQTIKTTVEPYGGKMAVIVNRGSASASEICAAALREQRGTPIIGARTAGAVLASVYGRLPHGFELQYPISDYITYRGVRLEDNPLLPDIEANTRATETKDEAMEKAVEAATAPKKG